MEERDYPRPFIEGGRTYSYNDGTTKRRVRPLSEELSELAAQCNTLTNDCCRFANMTSNIFALHLGVVPPEHVNAIVGMLVASIGTSTL